MDDFVIINLNLETKKFKEMVLSAGTHHMQSKIKVLEEMIYQAAAKGNDMDILNQQQENFMTYLGSLREVNGFNDVSDEIFVKLIDCWTATVSDLIYSWGELGIYEHNDENTDMELNVAKWDDIDIKLNRIFVEKKRGDDE